MERLRTILNKKRVAVAIAGFALVTSGCKGSFQGQLGELNPVNCADGPKSAVQELDLPAGERLKLSSYRLTNSDLSFISHGNGLSTPLLPPEAKMTPEGEVLFDNQDEKIHFSIKSSVGANETTHFKVSVDCMNP